MADRITEIVSSLNVLAKAIEDASAPHASKTMQELWGWNFPPLNGKQLASMARLLGGKISAIPDHKLNQKFSASTVTDRIDLFTANCLPYLWNGNGSAAAPQYFALLQWIQLVFDPVFEQETDWEKLSSDGLLPKQITSKLRSYTARFKNFDVNFDTIGEKIKYINDAHDAAEALPADLETLRSANEEVTESTASVQKNKILADAAREEIENLLLSIKESEKEARKLVENTEDAYSAATTRGLGEAFQQRANRLAISMWTWVGGLILALALGAIIGHFRVASLQEMLSKNAPSGAVSLNVVLAVLSIAAPVWFAWIATKQIGHRFRLSEDYAFKASVAQAYEGYRREAARIDPTFAKRLFSSALDRIDEAPIRFVENETFGSPLHELWKHRQSQTNATSKNGALSASPPTNKSGSANDDEAA